MKIKKIYVDVIRKHKICICGTQKDINRIQAKNKAIYKEIDCYVDLFESPAHEIVDVKLRRSRDIHKLEKLFIDEMIPTDDAERILYEHKENNCR